MNIKQQQKKNRISFKLQKEADLLH